MPNADPTPVQDAAAVTGLGRERAALECEIDGLRATLARLVEKAESILEKANNFSYDCDREDYETIAIIGSLASNIIADPTAAAALAWHEAQRQAARAEERERCALIAYSHDDCCDFMHGQRHGCPRAIANEIRAAIRTPEPGALAAPAPAPVGYPVAECEVPNPAPAERGPVESEVRDAY